MNNLSVSAQKINKSLPPARGASSSTRPGQEDSKTNDEGERCAGPSSEGFYEGARRKRRAFYYVVEKRGPP